MLQILVWEALASNLGRDTGYPHWGFSWFVPAGKCQNNASIRLQHRPSTRSLIHQSYNSTPYSLYTKSVVKQPKKRKPATEEPFYAL
jgi:hypothetical protein